MKIFKLLILLNATISTLAGDISISDFRDMLKEQNKINRSLQAGARIKSTKEMYDTKYKDSKGVTICNLRYVRTETILGKIKNTYYVKIEETQDSTIENSCPVKSLNFINKIYARDIRDTMEEDQTIPPLKLSKIEDIGQNQFLITTSPERDITIETIVNITKPNYSAVKERKVDALNMKETIEEIEKVDISNLELKNVTVCAALPMNNHSRIVCGDNIDLSHLSQK
ncbi:hypothetical protein [Halobacteriovorax sp. ZH2_bin.1]|uniref:hypothetical protein n=1 Tax=unclassified Halobacteriovorax TaxID=2639665 RepID=UPI003718E87D